jgi:Holliday junction resolvase RusA-like endonuclease
MKITLPKPPSVNHLYGRNKWGGVYLKPAANLWIEESLWIIKRLGRFEMITTPAVLSIDFYSQLGSDVDNILKITMDLLAKHAKIIKNDNLVHELHVKKFKCKKDEQRIELEIEVVK